MVREMLKIVQSSFKEYLLLLLALVMQGFFGYRFVYGAADTWKYSLSNLEVFTYVLSGLGMLGGYVLIGYVGYLFLQRRTSAPWLKLLQYLGVYCLGEVILAVVWGGIWVVLAENIWLSLCMSFTHYLFRIVFLAYVFSKAYAVRIGDAKGALVGMVLVAVGLSVLYGYFGVLGGFFVVVEAVCYYGFVVTFHTVCVGMGFTEE